MRVLHIHKDFQPGKGGGGTARHIHGLGLALAEHGCEVRVIAPDAEVMQQAYESVVAGRDKIGQHVAWADVVHVHGARSTFALAGAASAWSRGKPFFYTPHAYYGPRTSLSAVAKWIWDHTAERFLLNVGASTILLTDIWRTVLRNRGLPIEKTSIIPNCVAGTDLLVQPKSGQVATLPGNPSILSIGRLDVVKRIPDVVAALREPGLESAHFHIVGKGADRPAIEAIISQYDLENRVTLHGFVSDADVADMVAGADVFILASEQEGLPTVLLEMLMAGLPICCSQIPGNLAITDVAGIDTTFPVGNIKLLAANILRASQQTVTADQVSKLRRQFTWEQRVHDILALYRHALGQVPAKRAA